MAASKSDFVRINNLEAGMNGTGRCKLGQMLLEKGLITPEQLREALAGQRAGKKRLGRILIEQGLLSESELLAVLGEQLNIPQASLLGNSIDPAIATSIPAETARRYCIFPLAIKGNYLQLAMADPQNLVALDEAALLTGKEIQPLIASESAILHLINHYFGLKESLESTGEGEEEQAPGRLQALAEDGPIVRVVNSLIQRAIDEEASDIHLEPAEQGLRVRVRIDGILHELINPPEKTRPLITSRIKILAGLDIAERRLPQDGNAVLHYRGREVNLRVSTMPTMLGEKVVIRLLEKERIILPIGRLGFSRDNYLALLRLLENRAGLILVCGPTGSGKTTTLYSILNHINRKEDNIVTAEDPVEYRLPGINQIQVNPKINFGFAEILRSVLRQDPDIIMVGEIRDAETAKIAVQAALTGHLVLSTLHTNNAAGAVTRLADMGVEGYRLSASLLGVVGQRLVRVVCAHCREQYCPPEREQLFFQSYFGTPAPEFLVRGAGCRHCNRTGYRGRTGIHELLLLNRPLLRQVTAGAASQAIHEQAVRQGMVPLLHDGLRLVKEGVSTWIEVVKAAYNSVFDGTERGRDRMPLEDVPLKMVPVNREANRC